MNKHSTAVNKHSAVKYVGVDLHKKLIVICVVDQDRRVVSTARFTNSDTTRLTAWLQALGEFELVLEATASYEWFFKLVEPLARRVVLAHPRKLRIIAESTRKSDKVDARLLAEFLALTREVFLAEVAGAERFNSAKKLTSYVGLAPGQRESAGKRRDLGITHTGSPILRWTLHQASWQLVRRDPYWRDVFEKLAARRGKKKAITAIARRLLCLMLAVIRSGKPYQEKAPPAKAA